MAAEVVKNGSKRGRKSTKDDDEKEHQEEVVNNRSRVIRSRAQKLTEAPPAVEEKRARTLGKGKNEGKVSALVAETDDNAVNSTKSLRKRGDDGEEKSAMGSDEIMKGNGKVLKEILVNKQVAGEYGTVEPQLHLRRSKRGANIAVESEMCTNVGKHEKDEAKRSRKKTSKSLASDGSEENAEISRIDVNSGREEPIQKMEPRRSNRRKTMIQSGDVRGDTENGDKVVMLPTRVMRRSRRNASETGVTVENLDAEKHISELPLVDKESDAAQKNTRPRRNTSKCGPLVKIGEDYQENKVMKQSRGHVSGEDDIKSNSHPNSGTQSLEESSSQKVLYATDSRQSADERKQLHRLGKSDMLDASLHHGTSRIEESLILDVHLSASKDSDSAKNLCSENMISVVELTSITETNTKEEEGPIADDLANSDRNAASKRAELEVEKGNLLLEVVQNATDMDYHDPEAHVYSPMEGSGCITKTSDQVLEGVDGESEGSAETHTKKEEVSITDSADSSCMNLMNGEDLMNSETNAACKRADLEVEKGKFRLEVDAKESIEQNLADADKNDPEAQVYSPIKDSGCIIQSFLNADIEVAETEVNGFVQPCLRDNNGEDTPQTSGKGGVFESRETRHHGDNVAEENESFFENYPSDHFSEFNVLDLSNRERDARIVLPDRGNNPDECSVMHIAQQCYQAVDPSAIFSNSTDVKLKRGYVDDQMTQKEDRCIYEGINTEVSETRESESSEDHKGKCDEDGKFNLAELFNEEVRSEITPQEKENFSREHSDKDFTEGMSRASPSTAPTTMCNNTGDHEANLSAEVGETHNFNDKQLEITEAEESACMKSDKSSNSQETSPSTPPSVSETQEQQERLSVKFNALSNTERRHGACSDATELAGNAVFFLKSPEGKIIQVAEATHATSRQSWTEIELQKLFGSSDEDAPSGLGDSFHQGSERTNMTMSMINSTADMSETHCKSKDHTKAELSDAHLQKSGVPDNFHLDCTLDGNILGEAFEETSSDIEAAKNTGSEEDVTAKGTYLLLSPKASPVHDELIQSTDTDDLDGVKICDEADAKENSSIDISDESHTNREATVLKSLSDCDNQFEEAGDIIALAEHGSSVVNQKDENTSTKSEENSTAYMAQFPIQELPFEEDAEDFKNDTHGVLDLLTSGINEIFEEGDVATRVKNMTPCKAEETYFHESVSTESMSEKAQKAEHEVENNLSISASLSDDGGNDICEGINEVDSFELQDTSTGVLSGAVHNSCEALEDQLVQNNIVTTSCSPQDFNELESCTDMSETRFKSEDHTKAKLSDAHLQDSGVPDNRHLNCTLDGNILGDASEEISSDIEAEKNTGSEEDVTAKGTYLLLSPKASPIHDELIQSTDAADLDGVKICDEVDAKEKSSQDISDESHTNKEVTVLKSPDCDNQFEEAGNMIALAEHGSSVVNRKDENTSTKTIDAEKFVFNVSGENDNKASEKSEENSTDYMAHFPIQELPFEVNAEDFKNDTHAILDLPASGINIVLEESDVATRVKNMTPCKAEETCFHESVATDSMSGKAHNAEHEVENNLSISASLSDDGGNAICEGINEVESFEDLEALEDQLVQNNIVITSGSPQNFNELESCTDMSETHCKSEDHTKAELSDAHLQESGVPDNRLLDCTPDGNILGEVSVETSSDPEVSKIASSEVKEHGSSDANRKDVEKSVYSVSGDNDKDSEKPGENSTAEMAQFSIQELHIEENAEDFKNDALAISNLTASGIDEILKESDVADTIKEYIESESSRSVIFENSSASLSSDALAHTDETYTCEHSALSINGNDLAENDNVPPVDCVDAEMKLDEGAELLAGPAQVSENTANSPEDDDFFDEGSTVELKSQKKIKFKDGQSSSSQDSLSTMRKSNRTILILGTPSKLQTMPDKENAPYQKRSNAGDITAARPSKRRALQKLPFR